MKMEVCNFFHILTEKSAGMLFNKTRLSPGFHDSLLKMDRKTVFFLYAPNFGPIYYAIDISRILRQMKP